MNGDCDNCDSCGPLRKISTKESNTILARGSSQPSSSSSNRSKILVLLTRATDYAQSRSRVFSSSPVGAYPRVLGHPFVHLTADRAAHRKRNMRKTFE